MSTYPWMLLVWAITDPISHQNPAHNLPTLCNKNWNLASCASCIWQLSCVLSLKIPLYNSIYGFCAIHYIGMPLEEAKGKGSLLFSQKHKDFAISLPYENEVKEIECQWRSAEALLSPLGEHPLPAMIQIPNTSLFSADWSSYKSLTVLLWINAQC